MSQPRSTLPDPPQTGREVGPIVEPPTHLWPQVLAAFRDISGAFDPFANDRDQRVRAIGRVARQRRPPLADDYLALGDLCARLTLQRDSLSQVYAVKAITAYQRAASFAPADQRVAREMLVAFGLWLADVAVQIDGYAAINTAIHAIAQIRQIGILPPAGADTTRLQRAEDELRRRLERMFVDSEEARSSHRDAAVQESRALCDEGQMKLRNGQLAAALELLDRSVRADEANQSAWLWRAMALTDLGRYDDALASYDRALELTPQSAGIWNSKGALLMELSRLDAALDCFERALALSADVSTVRALYWLNKGKSLYMLGRYREAREALGESYRIEQTPESAAGIAACDEQLQIEG